MKGNYNNVYEFEFTIDWKFYLHEGFTKDEKLTQVMET